jgi:NifU-like protein
MWDYTEDVMEQFHHPKNVGKIDDPDGVGEVGSLACGDALTLMFKLDGEGRIGR